MKKKEKAAGRLQIGSMIAALVSAVAIFAVMVNAEKKALQDFEKKSVYVACREIPKGMQLTGEKIAEYIKEVQVDAGAVSADAMTDMSEIENLMSECRIETGTLLNRGMFLSVSEVTDQMAQPVLVGFKADDLYQVVGGVLREGDRIHVYVQDAETGEVALRWNDLYVAESFDSAGGSVDSENPVSGAQRFNVYLDQKDVEEFYEGLTASNLRVVKVCE